MRASIRTRRWPGSRREPEWLVGNDDPTFLTPTSTRGRGRPASSREAWTRSSGPPNVDRVGVRLPNRQTTLADAYRAVLAKPSNTCSSNGAALDEILERAAHDDTQRKPAETIAACSQVALWHGRYDLASAAARRLLREDVPPEMSRAQLRFARFAYGASRSPTARGARLRRRRVSGLAAVTDYRRAAPLSTRPSASPNSSFSSGVPTVTRIAPRRSRPSAGRSRPREGAARRAAASPRRPRRRGSSRPTGGSRPCSRMICSSWTMPSAFSRRRRASSSGASRSGQRGGLRQRVHVEGPPDLPDRGHELLRAERVADAEPGEPVDLRERPQHDDPPPRLQVLEPVHVLRVVDVLEVGLVEHRQDMSRTRSRNASSSALVFIVPVGLFGWQT